MHLLIVNSIVHCCICSQHLGQKPSCMFMPGSCGTLQHKLQCHTSSPYAKKQCRSWFYWLVKANKGATTSGSAKLNIPPCFSNPAPLPLYLLLNPLASPPCFLPPVFHYPLPPLPHPPLRTYPSRLPPSRPPLPIFLELQ